MKKFDKEIFIKDCLIDYRIPGIFMNWKKIKALQNKLISKEKESKNG